MLKLLRVIFVALLAVAGNAAIAQFTFPVTTPGMVGPKPQFDSLRPATNLRVEYFSRARASAERKALRKERNTVTFNASLGVVQTQFDNYASGGDNTFQANATLFFQHTYKLQKFSIDYKFDARYGMNYIDKKRFKNEDRFTIYAKTGWKMHNYWSYSADGELISQFSATRRSRTDDSKVSNFMSPGTLTLSVGFAYDRKPLTINISPVGGKAFFVLDDELKQRGLNGVPPGHSSRWQVGPSVRINFKHEFAKKILYLRSEIYSFTNIRTAPTLKWETTFEIRATKFLTTELYSLINYDKAAVTPKYDHIQSKYSLGLKLAYKFKNK